MDQSPSFQAYFFELIKHKIPSHQSLVDQVAEVLCVSNDSAYRRIRGEKILDLNEAAKLCDTYQLSMDAIFNLSSNGVHFQYNSVDHDNFHYYDYLQYVQSQLDLINKFERKELFFAAKDIPFFHYFQFPELTYFKSYFWMKMILEYPEYDDKQFLLADAPDEIIAPAKNIWTSYMKTPSVEIWSNETINITLRQIEYCWECGFFKSEEEALLLCELMKTMLKHIQTQAGLGNKFHFESNATKEGGAFNLYYNEVTISDNTIFFKMDGQELAFISHNLFNILSTGNPNFCQHTYQHIQQILRKSTLISEVSEKERKKFFRNMKKKITDLIDKIG
ncbi:hypothetical protein QQ020_10975 [Fulvivirgaceae bacterium BMA12]|uniref:BetR domain-containing protein n=1 Tax=Agaribacillus aureus TaxID=3051825 RepID=A0ABT8L4C6_9BACT|nr:hypothetical protein [Fulvivirgaceae bacterium BMA12]